MFKNIIGAFLSKGLVALANFGILITTAHYLGSNVVGQMSVLILNVAIIQTVNEIYTGSSLVHFIPGHPLVGYYKRGILFSLLGTIGFNALLFLYNGGNGDLWMHVLVLSFVITMNAFHNVLLLARQKIVLYNVLTFMQPALLFVVLWVQIMLPGERGLNNYLLSMYVSFLITLSISLIYVLKIIVAEHSAALTNTIAIFKNGTMNQLGNLAHTLSNRLNYYLLGSASLVGVYASSTSLIEGVWIISGSISPVILSYVANRQNEKQNAMVTLTLAKISFLLGLVAIIVVAILPVSFFVSLLGSDFAHTKMVMLCLSPGILCLTFSSIISHYFSGLGLQKIQLGANLSGLLVTVCLAWPFIQFYGLYGAGYAASLAYFTQAAVLCFVFFKKTDLPLKSLLNLNLKLESKN